MPTIHEIKEQELLETPVLLFECELRNGQRHFWATHRVDFEGVVYEARLLEHTGFDIRAYSEDGIDASAKVSLVLANADSRYSQLERTIGFKGSRLHVRFVFFDLAANAPASEAITVFRGLGNAPDQIRESTFRVTFNNRLNFQRILLPEVRIQKRCPWLFPATAEQRVEAITGGSKGVYSPFFRCGYSAGIAGGVGNLNGDVPFESCDYTRKACTERGMFRQDSLVQITRRFGGIEFVPSSIAVRGHGDKVFSVSAVQPNEAKYNDFVPVVYGTCWVQPPITLARNDGNLTRMEALVALGEIEGILTVVVNDVEIPLANDGANMTATGWYHWVGKGNRTGDFNLNFADALGQPLGDPYGSMAYLSIVVPNRIQDGRSLPRVQVLVKGSKLPIFDTAGEPLPDSHTSNPAWILLDVLRKSGWTLDEVDLPSFSSTAAYCDDPIETVDLHGNPLQIPRFQCNLTLRRRRSAAEVIRGIRNCAGLYLTFGQAGKLQLRQESTLGVQQPVQSPGSNASTPLFGGWAAYEFDEGDILRDTNGEPRVRVYSRNSADTPNRYSVEFQDAFNEYQQDSFSLLDLEDVVTVGQEISASLPALGLANFDQASRVTKLHLLKSVRGNVYLEIMTSVKALGVQPGDLVTVSYAKEGLDRQLFRVLRLTPGQNFRTVQLTLQWHDESWYVQTAGKGMESSGRQPRYELGLPRPLIGTVLDEDGNPQLGVVETYTEETDGRARTELSVDFYEPRKPASSRAGIPLLSLSPSTEPIGGSLAGDQNLYYALTGSDAEAREGGTSFIVRAVIPPGSNTNLVTLTGLSFGPGTESFSVYRGPTPQQLSRIGSDLPLASSFVDTGLAAGLISPPDENFSHANFYWRLELQGEWPATVSSLNTIGNPVLTMLANEWRTKTVRITKGKGLGQERRIESNTATECVLTETWAIVPDASSSWVIIDSSWIPAATTSSSPARFEVPNREGATLQVTGRAANASNRECSPELSPVTRWRLNGSSGAQLDIDVPPAPTFALSTTGDGTIEIQSIGFPELVNTRTVTTGTLVLHYWDELRNPSATVLSGALDVSSDVLVLSAPGQVAVNQIVQIGQELLEVLAVSTEGTSIQVVRGAFGSLVSSHAIGTAVYPLDSRAEIMPFGRDFFGSPASGSYAFSIHLPAVRVAGASLYLTNTRGNSVVSNRSVTNTLDDGLRTMQGGQINIQLEGWLAIEDSATPPVFVDRPLTIRDIFAIVQEAPSGGPVTLRLRQDNDLLCVLTIEAGATLSNVAEGFSLPPLRNGAYLHLDIVSLSQSWESTPGSDLTVTIRL
jgi:hypothetical protein